MEECFFSVEVSDLHLARCALPRVLSRRVIIQRQLTKFFSNNKMTEQQSNSQTDNNVTTCSARGLGYPAHVSSSYDANHTVQGVDINYTAPRVFSHCWSAGANDASQWLQISFLQKVKVVNVSTQGASYCYSHYNQLFYSRQH